MGINGFGQYNITISQSNFLKPKVISQVMITVFKTKTQVYLNCTSQQQGWQSLWMFLNCILSYFSFPLQLTK